MENSGVHFAMSPIKKLVIVSLALHMLSLGAVVMIVVLQRYLSVLFFSPHSWEFVLPALSCIAMIAFVFIIHVVFTVTFWQAIHSEENRTGRFKVISILVFVCVIVVIPILQQVETLFAVNMTGHLFMLEYLVLRNMISYGLVIRGFGLTGLLIAAGMAIYYSYLAKGNGGSLD